MQRAFWCLLAISCVLVQGISGEAAAQAYPDKPVRLIAPFTPGG